MDLKCRYIKVILWVCCIAYSWIWMDAIMRGILLGQEGVSAERTGVLLKLLSLIGMSRRDSVYKSRGDLLKQECFRLRAQDPIFAESQKTVSTDTPLLVETTHQILYCPIAKSGTTILRSLLQLTSGVKNVSNIYDIVASGNYGKPHDASLKRLNLNYPSIVESLSDYGKFMFVRDPYSRLFSAYISKFFEPNIQYWQQMGRKIIATFRQNASARSLECGHDVTFPEFIRSVIADIKRNTQVDRHWEPMYVRCQPCAINYDVIGKTETIHQDMEYLIRRFNLSVKDVSLGYISGDFHMDQVIMFSKEAIVNVNKLPKGCMNLQDSLHRILRRHQIQGLIHNSFKLSAVIDDASATSSDIIDIFRHAYQRFGIHSDTMRRRQKREALLEAYNSVPIEELQQILSLFYADFSLFGYDQKPIDLFHRKDY